MSRLLLACAVAASLGVAPTARAQCQKDTDCKGDRICVSGKCVEPPAKGPTAAVAAPAAAPAGVATPAAAAAPARVPERNFHINTLDLLEFGLAPTVEWGAETTFMAKVRFLNAGLLPYLLIADPASDETFKLGLGAGVGVRKYLAPGVASGTYLGFTLEYAYTVVEDTVDDLARYTNSTLIPLGEFGYRWWFGKTLVDVGVMAGANVPISSSAEPIGAGGCPWTNSCTNSSDTVFMGMFVVDVGWGF